MTRRRRLRVFGGRKEAAAAEEEGPAKRILERDYYVEDLAKCNGDDGRVRCVALKGKIFNVKNSPFGAFAGRDITRAVGLSCDYEGTLLEALQKACESVPDEEEGTTADLTPVQLARVESTLAIFLDSFKVEGRLVRPRGYTLDELAAYDGRDGRRVYLAAKGVVYDVTRGEDFYGPEGAYNVMAGRDASRALALMSLEKADVDNPTIDDLGSGDLYTLDEWIAKFEMKYTKMGFLMQTGAQKNGDAEVPSPEDKE